MTLAIKVIYEGGIFRPLEPVNLPEGQTAMVTVEQSDEREALKALLGDLVQWSNPNDDRHAWVEQEAEAIEEALKGLRPLSEIIIEERGEQL